MVRLFCKQVWYDWAIVLGRSELSSEASKIGDDLATDSRTE